ncbi:MAG: gamma-glutamyl-gamma-aminobutyrate hydrolase family protein [Geminicoccaceae bacterium]|nr:MAG: gamma-glutamyl-gamma-aminobutyrate hydrolase family protein [Geminicoccaceae bacterium]
MDLHSFDRSPPPPRVPVVGISCCRKMDGAWPTHSVGEKYITAITDAAGAVPFLIPALGPRLDVDAVLAQLDGLFLTGSPSNVEPHHYAGGPEPLNNLKDPERDVTTLALIRRALAQGVPLFAVCRGIQELNVALGGSLHQELHVVDGRFDHRSDKTKTPVERYGDRHPVRLTAGGYMATLLQAETLHVNSLHGQGLDRLAQGLVVEAVAEDGTIEAARVADAATFALGVQWHPEFKPLTNRASTLLFRAFGEACSVRARARQVTLVG